MSNGGNKPSARAHEEVRLTVQNEVYFAKAVGSVQEEHLCPMTCVNHQGPAGHLRKRCPLHFGAVAPPVEGVVSSLTLSAVGIVHFRLHIACLHTLLMRRIRLSSF